MEGRLREILGMAIRHHVTDIHMTLIESFEEQVRIEMRVDGVIRRVRPKEGDAAFFRYLMYRAELDLSNCLEPQTGAFAESLEGKNISLRFAVVTSFRRTSGVLRILNNHSDLTIDDLSFDEDAIAWMKNITNHRCGLFVFSGPTGSGKTTSLYTILNACSRKKIFTLEDPIEVFSDNFIQLQINEKQHLSYADGIRQLMRHDPDIVMIGEIRDGEAAKMAVRCALTGHLVVTSLHASSCVSALHRLMDLGVEDYQLQDVIAGICNQRLFTDMKGGKVGIYEIMDRKEAEYWFREGRLSDEFVTLGSKVTSAVENGILSAEEAERDLLE